VKLDEQSKVVFIIKKGKNFVVIFMEVD